MNIVLVEPEIPQNTGNVVRTCAVTGSTLHLIKPLGFSLEDKFLKRAGLDYWHLLDIKIYNNFAELKNSYPQQQFYFATNKAKTIYTEINYQKDDFIVFGKETAGLSKEILDGNENQWIRIPMIKDARSINLSNSVAIVLFEGLRQGGFVGLV